VIVGRRWPTEPPAIAQRLAGVLLATGADEVAYARPGDHRHDVFNADYVQWDKPDRIREILATAPNIEPADPPEHVTEQAQVALPLPCNRVLHEKHRQNLEASGLTPDTIARSGIYSEDDRAELARILNRRSYPKERGAAAVYPVRRPGEPAPYAYRVRPDDPREVIRNGKVRLDKYLSPDGAGILVYFVPLVSADDYRDVTRPLHITEGEKKGLLLAQLGHAALALTGVQCAHDVAHRKKTGTWRLHPMILEHVEFRGRDVVIVFDWSVKAELSDEFKASRRIATMCLDAGARSVRYVTPPDSTAKGIDDHFVARGEVATRELLASAREIKPAPGGTQQDLADQTVPGWTSKLRRGKGDKVLATTSNIAAILRNSDHWSGRLRFNTRAQCIEVLPGSPINDPDQARAREFRETDLARIAIWLCDAYEIDLAPNNKKLWGAMQSVAEERSYDPFLVWLEQQIWDRVPRLDEWLVTYCGAKNTPLNRAFGSRFMIGGVARAVVPGAKMDTMLILEGEQGRYKSTTIQTMCPDPAMFSDNCPADLSEKAAQQHLLGKLFVEIAELDALKKTGTAALKAFLSRTTDKYRIPYDRLETTQPRRCVFIGTTNGSTYLHDATGGRRFWPVLVTTCRPEEIRRDRSQLWAEAFHRYRAGERWHIDESEHGLLAGAREAQEQRRETDPWEARIRGHLELQEFVLMANLLTMVLDIPLHMQSAADGSRVKRILTAAGWVMRRPRVKDPRGLERRERRYYPADSAPDDTDEVAPAAVDAARPPKGDPATGAPGRGDGAGDDEP
jgi:predicted P-loop ATPase